MSATERLHALDAVRAAALILGIFLHAAMPFLSGLPRGFWVWADTPSTTLAGLFFFIHLFRMSAFFVIAGLFARMVVERRGIGAFVRDRAKRIGVPLLLGLPLILLSIIAAALGAAAIVDVELPLILDPTPEQAALIPEGYFPWAHLWFLYYLLIFYVLALLARTAVRALDRAGFLRAAADHLARFAFSGPLGAVVPAVPIGLYFYNDPNWITWAGLPAPYLYHPEIASLIGYGVPFALGWLVHRQLDLIPALGRQWRSLSLVAVALALAAYIMAGPTPSFTDTSLAGGERIAYTAVYMLAQWCAILAFIAVAVRLWSHAGPARRYVADASYWLYLMHMTVLAFFAVLLGPLDWHWSVKYTITVGISIPLLLFTYHYCVRATFIGALLSGRRLPRERLFSTTPVR